MSIKKDLLSQLGWTKEEIEHFLIDDNDTSFDDTWDTCEYTESISTETQTISFRIGVAETRKIVVK